MMNRLRYFIVFAILIVFSFIQSLGDSVSAGGVGFNGQCKNHGDCIQV